MTVAFVAVVGLVVTRLPLPLVAAAVTLVWIVTASPVLLIPAAVIGLATVIRTLLRRREAERRSVREDLASLAEMTAMGLSGGLGIQSALQAAADAVGGPVGAEASGVLRQMHIDGLGSGVAMPGAGSELYRTIGRAAASGASLLEPVLRVADELHADLAATRLEEVRRIPVAMLFPLTLLILPGFLLLTVAPALLEAFGRLEI